MKRFLTACTLVLATVTITTLQPLAPAISHAEALPKQSSSQNTPDARVSRALNSLNLRYEVQNSGAYRVTVRFNTQDRRQSALITSSTNTISSLEVREVSSLAYIHNGPLPANLANRLLQDNSRRTLGAWRILQLSDGSHAVLFAAQVDANASPEHLQAVLTAVLSTADLMEQELTNEDRF